MSEPFGHLSPEDRARARELAERFRAAGADEPEAWALSEVEENIPQLARFLFLRMLWRSAGDWALPPEEWFADREPDRADEEGEGDADELLAEAEAVDEGAEPAFLAAQQAVRRILAAGADPEDLKLVARAIFTHAAFDAVQAVDEGHDPEAGDGLPGWLLVEVGGDLVLTGRMVDSLHEDLLTTEPE